MTDPHSPQTAARLSEDIGDVLSAIRRLIAEDEALSAEREGRRSAIAEDGGDFLARRHGGNAALARQLSANHPRRGPGYVQPASLAAALEGDTKAPKSSPAPLSVASSPAILRHEAGHKEDRPATRNDLARALSAAGPVPVRNAPGPRSGKPHTAVTEPPSVLQFSSPGQRAEPAAPLRLDAARRVVSREDGERPKSSGWRGWFRPEPPVTRLPEAPARAASGDMSLQTAEALSVDDEADYAEAFAWKARMRPEMPLRRADIASDAAGGSAPDGAFGRDEAAMTASFAAANCRTDEPLDTKESLAPPALAVAEGVAHNAIEVEAVHDTITGLPREEEEQSIRDLLRDMIQEELQGELGARFSRNLRGVIRREIAAAIDDQLDRL